MPPPLPRIVSASRQHLTIWRLPFLLSCLVYTLSISTSLQLTNYYTMTLCTPARASIMTGRYPVRYGVQYAVIMPGSPWGLPLNEKVGGRHCSQSRHNNCLKV